MRRHSLSFAEAVAIAELLQTLLLCRKCKLVTSGPWKEVGTTPLIAVSIQVDHAGDDARPVALWAIETNGDALCRLGVTSSCPEVRFVLFFRFRITSVDCLHVFRAWRGNMFRSTSRSSQSVSEETSRFGPWRGTGRPFYATGSPSGTS